MILVNGIEGSAVDARDRGFAYGDGVFRTLRLRAGTPLLWPRQYSKLEADCAALAIACPPATVLEGDLAMVAARNPDGVVKITLTRGIAARGYAIPHETRVTRAVSWSAPSVAPDRESGIRARWCDLRLAIQPALAGIKHLNRLENVLARSEWRDPAIAEGLLRDTEGHVIGGTMSNLFLLRDGCLITPTLSGSGVAGATRDIIIERARAEGIAVHIAPITPQEVGAADALFLVNSVIGVWPVAALEELTWRASNWSGRLRNWISDAESR
jgi:4-amino-4-deoxychorismate lyase